MGRKENPSTSLVQKPCNAGDVEAWMERKPFLPGKRQEREQVDCSSQTTQVSTSACLLHNAPLALYRLADLEYNRQVDLFIQTNEKLVATFSGGRLKLFATNSQQITSDPTFLRQLLGTKLNFVTPLPVIGPLMRQFLATNQAEPGKLLAKQVIVKCKHKPDEYISSIFLWEKKDGMDHGLLLERLSSAYGIEGLAHSWLESYLTRWTQAVKIGNHVLEHRMLQCGVSQGSVLGPILFTMYTAPIGNIVCKHGLTHHLHADDTQLYISFDPDSADSAVKRAEVCIAETAAWMGSKKLMLNDGKTEAVFMTRRPQELPPESTSLLVRDNRVVATSAARNLNVIFENTMRMDKQVDAPCKAAHYHLSNIGRIRHLLSDRAAEQLVHAFVTARLDNGNSLLLGITKTQLARLQRVQNLAARIVTHTCRHEHITPVLHSVHWLPVSYRIQYKVLLLTFKALNGQAPSYLTKLLQPYQPIRHLRSTAQHLLTVPISCYATAGDRAFRNAAPRLWNGLPATARACTSLNVFKSYLKSILFCTSLLKLLFLTL